MQSMKSNIITKQNHYFFGQGAIAIFLNCSLFSINYFRVVHRNYY